MRRRWAGKILLIVSISCFAFSARWPCRRTLNAEPIAPAPFHEAGAVASPEDPPAPVVSIRVRVPACAAAGRELEYHLCVENQSAAPAHHVLVRNPLPAHARFVRAKPEPTGKEPELVWQLGTLEPCACCEIVLVLAPTGTGDVVNCARVQFEHGQCVCTKIARPSIGLRKEGPAQAILYDALTYRLTVTNTGGVEVSGVVLTDPLPDGLESADGKKALTWELGTLAPGQCRTVEYQAVAKKTGKLCNKAVATATGGLREEAESCVSVAEAKITLAKAGPERRYVNLPAAYQITVTNAGAVPFENVTVADPLPADATFVSASNDGRLENNQVRWQVGGLAAGASRTVDVVLRARKAGRICNRATATADRGLTAQAEACTEFVGESALLLEVVDTDDPVELGGDTSYVILVRNQGSVPATRVVISAQVPDQFTVTRVTGPADHRKDIQRVVFEPVTLEAQNTARFVIYVKARRPGDVRFKVDLTADQLTSGPVHEEESTTVYVDFPPERLRPEARRQNRIRTRP